MSGGTSVGRRNPTGRMTNKMKPPSSLALLLLAGCCCISAAMSQRTGKILFCFCSFAHLFVTWISTFTDAGRAQRLLSSTRPRFSFCCCCCRNRSSFVSSPDYSRRCNVDHTKYGDILTRPCQCDAVFGGMREKVDRNESNQLFSFFNEITKSCCRPKEIFRFSAKTFSLLLLNSRSSVTQSPASKKK